MHTPTLRVATVALALLATAVPAPAEATTVALSAANAGTTITNPVDYTETNPLVQVTGTHLSRVADAGAAYPDSMTPANTTSFQAYDVAIRTDAPKIEMRFRGAKSKFKLWIDDVSPTGNVFDPAGGPFYRYTVTFPDRALRTIRFSMDAERFASFTVAAGDTVVPLPAPKTRAIIVGDSFTEGSMALARYTSWAKRFCGLAGWDDCWASGSGGTGYLTNGAPAYTGRVTFRERIVHDVIAYHPDIVVIAGGRNDGGKTAQALGDEARLLYQQVRDALPTAQIVVTGLFPASAAEGQSMAARSDVLRQASAGIADEFLDVTGSGSYFTTANQSTYTSSDGLHPNQAGHDALANALFAQYVPPSSGGGGC